MSGRTAFSAIAVFVMLAAASARAGAQSAPDRKPAAPPAAAGEPAPGPGSGAAEGEDGRDPGRPFDEFNQPAPRGQDPGAWQTWATQQKITRTERVSISLFLGGAIDLMGDASDVFDDNGYDEYWKSDFTGGLEVGFTLMPMLNIYIGGAFNILPPGHVRISSGGPFRFEPDQGSAFQICFGTRLKFPVNLIGKRLFSIAKAECGYGFVPYLKFAVGYSKLGKVELENLDTWTSSPWFRESDGVCFTIGFGVEVRGRYVGGFLELFMADLGTPKFELSTSQKADSITAVCLVIGIAFYI